MKKLILMCSLVCGIAYAQPQLAIVSVDSASPAVLTPYTPTWFLYGLEVKNFSPTDTFNNVLIIHVGIKDDLGVVHPMDSVNTGVQFIPSNDSIFIDSVSVNVDTSLFKEGNNTVVIWPAVIGSSGYTLDSLEGIQLYTSIAELMLNNLIIKTGPNPAGDYLYLHDPDNLLKDVRIINTQGQYIPAPFNGNVLTLIGIPRGMYILELTTTRGVFSRKLMVER